MTLSPLIAAIALLGSLATLPVQAAVGSVPAERAEPVRVAATAQADALLGVPSSAAVNAPARRQARVAVSSMVERAEAEPVQTTPETPRAGRIDRI